MGGFADGTMHYVSAQRPPALLAIDAVEKRMVLKSCDKELGYYSGARRLLGRHRSDQG
jgi:hypothetical protein